MPFAAVIFDLDGTLLDTLEDIGHSTNQVLVDFGYPTHSIPDYRYFVGDGVKTLFLRVIPQAQQDDEALKRCMEAFAKVYRQHWNEHTSIYDGVGELLQALVERDVATSVLSNKPHEFTRQCVDTYFGEHPFRCVFGQRDGIPRKPDPAGVEDILQATQVPREQVVYVGDTATDMQTAKAAQLYAVGVSWGFRPVAELLEAGADTIINHPTQLLDLLS